MKWGSHACIDEVSDIGFERIEIVDTVIGIQTDEIRMRVTPHGAGDDVAKMVRAA